MTASRVFIFLCLAIAVTVIGIELTHRKSRPALVPSAPTQANTSDFRSASYLVDGQNITLKNGVFEAANPESSSTTTTSYFGNEAHGDLNGDGKEDVAFILTQTGGGSGTFYFLVAALKTDTGYQGTNTIFLGDRVAPMATEITGGMIIANFAERKPGEPFAAEATVATSTYARMVKGKLTEVPKP